MNKTKFEKLAHAAGYRDSASLRALKLVLVNNMGVRAAGRVCGIDHSTVSAIKKRFPLRFCDCCKQIIKN